MKRLTVFFIAGALLVGASHAQEKTDEVKGWGRISDPEGDCQFIEKDGKLTIKVPAGYHDFHPADPYKNNGARVYQEVAGDFTVEVKVTPNLSPKAGHELAGKTNAFHAATLLIWQDAKNFIRLDRTGMWSKGKFVTGVYFHVFKDGKRIFELAPLVKDEETILSLERKGKTIKADAKQGGKSVVSLPTQTVVLPDNVQIGLGAINASTVPMEAVFSELKITPGKKK